MRVGVDIGGTFTDLVMVTDEGLRVHKLLSTLHDPAEAMLQGLDAIASGLSNLTHVAHGSTIATNAILERRGARVAFITTAGFRDLLAIGRQNRPDLYALHPTLPAAIVQTQDCYEVIERLDQKGSVLVPLAQRALTETCRQIAAQKYDAIAVCLLFSFLNARHEQKVRETLVATGAFEAWQIALSSDVLPEFREYERASTTALEAYVRPIMTRYVQNLRQKLPANVGLYLMKSDGGVMPAERVQERAAHTALSGPAAGVIGAQYLAKMAGYDDIITLDIGGASTDVALCKGDVPLATQQQVDGLPLRLRMLAIETIGAGGGSLARVDAGGVLRVGPHSAGASPGPIAYGRGGTQVTVTDANVLLGRLNASHFLGGQVKLEEAAVKQELINLGKKLGRDAVSAAEGIVQVANAEIERALRRVSIERGHDPRRFTLVAFGGAGPLHACEVAQSLDMTQVLVPLYPGVLCALGLLLADVRVDSSMPILSPATIAVISQMRVWHTKLMSNARDELRADGIPDKAMKFEATADMRYVGQAYELSIPFEGDLVAAFHHQHEREYGYNLPDRAVEIITLRLRGIGTTEGVNFQPEAVTPYDAQPQERGQIARYDRGELRPGATFTGEAIVTQLDATTYVPVGWTATVDAWRNLVLVRE